MALSQSFSLKAGTWEATAINSVLAVMKVPYQRSRSASSLEESAMETAIVPYGSIGNGSAGSADAGGSAEAMSASLQQIRDLTMEFEAGMSYSCFVFL